MRQPKWSLVIAALLFGIALGSTVQTWVFGQKADNDLQDINTCQWQIVELFTKMHNENVVARQAITKKSPLYLPDPRSYH